MFSIAKLPIPKLPKIDTHEFDFTDTLIRAVAIPGTICVLCEMECSNELDHILGRQYAKYADNLGVDMTGESNAAWICARCHFEKSRRERFVGSNECGKHWAKYYRLIFTPAGNRRIVPYATIIAHQDWIQRIQKSQMELCLARQRGQDMLEDQLILTRARLRREARVWLRDQKRIARRDKVMMAQ